MTSDPCTKRGIEETHAGLFSNRMKFFTKRNQLAPEIQKRLPPNQRLAKRWPVLTYGPTPDVDIDTWRMRVFGEVERPIVFTWDDVMAMPQVEVHADMHCVTRWSKLDNLWQGVSLRTVLDRIQPKPAARFVMIYAYGDYTTNLPLDALDDEDVLLAHSHNGEPLSREHGAPLRLVVPKRYAWKSAKWVNGLEFMPHDRAGFWEKNGYHNDGDPWQEERYSF